MASSREFYGKGGPQDIMKLASFYVDFKAKKGVDVAELRDFIDNYIDNYRLAIISSYYELNTIRVYGDSNALDEVLMMIPFDLISDVRSYSCGIIEIPFQKLMDKHFKEHSKGRGYHEYIDFECDKPHVETSNSISEMLQGFRGNFLPVGVTNYFIKANQTMYIMMNIGDFTKTLRVVLRESDLIPTISQIKLDFPTA